MKSVFICCLCINFFSIASAQKIPQVSFNHLFFVLKNEDLAAIQQSDFIKNKLAVLETRTSKASSESWTGTYLNNYDNYIELFDTSGVSDSPLGSVGIGFSVDRLKDLDQLNTTLSKEYTIEKFDQTKEYDSTKIPWYHGIYINDSIFYTQSVLGFWIMAYDTAYFNYNKLSYKENVLTRKDYMQKNAAVSKKKIVKHFTGATLNLTRYEKEYFSNYLLHIGFRSSGDNEFSSDDNSFTFKLKNRPEQNGSVLSILSFDTNFSNSEQVVKISGNVSVLLKGNNGQLVFK